MGRWIGRLILLLLLLAALVMISYFMGRPQPVRLIEVDVTDQLRSKVPGQ